MYFNLFNNFIFQVWLVCCNLLHVICEVHQENLSLIQLNLGCQFLGLCLLQLRDAGSGLGAHDATSPNAYLLISVIVVGLDGFHKLGKCTLILTMREQNQSTRY
uniref:Secreted protein n=1 Tax=Scophthalmus maximus TaxID=52904 RepID=A0A8D3ACT1_SCOMX